MGRPRLSRRSVCVALTTRGNYAKMKSTLCAASAHPGLELRVVIGGALLDASYGDFEAAIAGDGFAIDDKLDYAVGDDSLGGIAEAAGKCTAAMARVIGRLRPDVALVIADRYEALSIALAATCMNVTIAHLEGGEISGSIDERIRHAITKLADLHFPANDAAAARIGDLDVPDHTVFTVGTPSLDLLGELDLADVRPLFDLQARDGEGDAIDFNADYLVVSQHPVVTEYDSAQHQIDVTAAAIDQIGLPAVWFMPNMDAGGDGVARAIAEHRSRPRRALLRYFASMEMESYATLLSNSRCLVGNSSSGIRECAFLGVPVVNIGTRQQGRARGPNVIDVGHDTSVIADAVRGQIDHGRYPSDTLYGDGRAGERIASALIGWRAADASAETTGVSATPAIAAKG